MMRQALIAAIAAADPTTVYNALAQWCEQERDGIAAVDEINPATVARLETIERIVEACEAALAPPPPCNAAGTCEYHRSGGPQTIACGTDTYNGHTPLR